MTEEQDNYKTGWIKLYRSLANKSWFGNGDYLKLWIYLLMQATHKEIEYLWNGKVIILKPGQFITGRKQIANAICAHESSVERMLTFFEKIEQQIEQQKSNTSRLISIVNYESYQTSEQPSEQRLNNGRTTAEQRLNTKQECKELKNDKKIFTPPQFLKPVLQFSDTINSTLRDKNSKDLEAMIRGLKANGKSEAEQEQLLTADTQAYQKTMEWINANAPRVNQMKEPLTVKQFVEIRSRYDSPAMKELVLQKLKNMHNHEPLLRKNRVTYLTLINWILRDANK